MKQNMLKQAMFDLKFSPDEEKMKAHKSPFWSNREEFLKNIIFSNLKYKDAKQRL